MFKRLVITQPESLQKDRKWYFLFSSTFLSTALVAGLIISLFSVDFSLGTDNFELAKLATPVEQPVMEPEPPQPEQFEQPVVEEKTVSKLPTRVVNKRPTRRVHMANLDETPRSVPKVSTRPNTHRARPANMYYEIGRMDSDLGAGYMAGPAKHGMGSSGTGSGTSAAGRPAVRAREATPPPPPPVKKKPKIAKKPPVKKPITRSMGVINGKAISLPKPRYPAAARAIRARGKVNVKVLVSENGRVVSANAVSGHPLLRNAAESAARGARFHPTLLSGVPVKVSGVIVYNFLG